MSSPLSDDPRPWLIAHKAANSLERLADAERAGADFAEGDLWSFRGHVEVRHEKTLGALPVRWDRWKLELSRTPHIHLDTLLAAEHRPPALLIDVKGRDLRLPAALLAALERHPVPVVVCARRPAMLDLLAANGLPVFPSVGGESDLVRLERLSWKRQWDGVSVHRKLLTERFVERLRRLAPHIISWPVNTHSAVDELTALGIDGFICDNLALVAELAQSRAQAGGVDSQGLKKNS